MLACLRSSNNGADLLDPDIEEDDIENPLIQKQIEFCSTPVLNKTDFEQLHELKALVRGSSDAPLLRRSTANIPMSELINTGRLTKPYASAAWMDAMEHP